MSQSANAALSRMNALQQFIEMQPAIMFDYDFAIQDKLPRRQFLQGRNEFRKIPAQRLASFGLQCNFFAAAKSQAAKAIPFRFILPVSSAWNFLRRPRFHGWEWRLNRQIHLLEIVSQRS